MRTNFGQKCFGIFLVLCLLLGSVTSAMATSTPSVSSSVTSVTVSEVTFSGIVVDDLVVVVATDDDDPVDLSSISDLLYINVVPAMQEEKALGEEKEWLETTREVISSITFLTELSTLGVVVGDNETEEEAHANAESAFVESVLAVLASQGASHVGVEQLVVRDYVAVNATEVVKQLLQQGNPVNVKTDFKLDKNTPYVLLFSLDGKTWDVIPSEYIVYNEDGTLTVTLYEFGVIALATPEE